MISFKIGDTVLDYGGQSMGMIYRSTVLKPDSSLGNRSFSIRFPFTATNDKFFGFQRFSDSADKTRSWQAECLYNGASLHYGRLVLFAVRDGYECYFYPSNTENERMSTLLNEIDGLDEEVVLGVTSADVAEASQLPNHADGYAFPPLYAPDWYGNRNETFTGVVNPKRDDTPGNLVNDGSGNYFAIAPGLYVDHVLKKVAAYLGYNLTGDLLADNRFKELVMEGNLSLDESSGVPYLSELSAEATTSELHTPFRPELGVVSGGGYIGTGSYDSYLRGAGSAVSKDYTYYEVQEDGRHRVSITKASLFNEYDEEAYYTQNMEITVYLKLWRAPLVGDPILVHVWEISGMRNQFKNQPSLFGIWEPHEFEALDGDKIYFEIETTYIVPSTGETLDGYAQVKLLDVSIENAGTAELNSYAKSFNKLDVVPDVSIKDLLTSTRQWCACVINFNDVNKTMELKTIGGIIMYGTPEDWTDKVLEGRERDLSQAAHLEWKLSGQSNDGDSYLVKSRQPDAAVKTITPAFGSLPTEWLTGLYIGQRDQRKYVCPGAGRSLMFDQPDSARPTRFLRVRAYPGEGIYTQTLKQAGEGFGDDIAYFWRNVAPLLANAEVEIYSLKLTEVDIQNLDMTKKKVINGVEYMLQELRVPYDPGRIGVCVGEFVKVNV